METQGMRGMLKEEISKTRKQIITSAKHDLARIRKAEPITLAFLEECDKVKRPDRVWVWSMGCEILYKTNSIPNLYPLIKHLSTLEDFEYKSRRQDGESAITWSFNPKPYDIFFSFQVKAVLSEGADCIRVPVVRQVTEMKIVCDELEAELLEGLNGKG